MLGILELFARAFLKTPPRLLEQDAAIGVRYRPGFADNVYVEEAEREVYLRFNRDGFRDENYAERAAPGVRRVAILGDSFVAAVATDEDRTMVRLIEKNLESSIAESDWEVMNFGVSSSSTGQELLLYREVVRRYRPDVVLCFFTVLNDLSDNSPRLSRAQRLYFDLDEHGEPKLKSQSGIRSESRNWINLHSTFYRWQKTTLNTLRARAMEKAQILKPGRWIYCADQQRPEDVGHAWELTEGLLTTFASDVRQDGAVFALVVVPSPEQVYKENWTEMMAIAGEAGVSFDPDYPSQQLANLAAAAQFPLFDMTPAFRSAAPNASIQQTDEWLFYRARGHFNDRGNALAADAVAGWLKESLLVPQAP